jgi:hypothetical protein
MPFYNAARRFIVLWLVASGSREEAFREYSAGWVLGYEEEGVAVRM